MNYVWATRDGGKARIYATDGYGYGNGYGYGDGDGEP